MDISLDLNDPNGETYRDLLVRDGDLVLTSDADARGAPAILQDILQRLSTFKGEWFLNTSIGVPYFQVIFRKGARRSDIDDAIQNVILKTPGVQRLTDFQSTYTTANRLVRIRFRAATAQGTVQYEGALNGPNGWVQQ